MDVRKLLKDAASLLYWSMLAACTVGPGTVVTCARAGAEYELNLIWALIFASVLAYTLQEGTARLTIVSGKSLGECLQAKYSHGYKLWQVGIICWVVAVAVFVGNLLYECNNFAGGMSAIYSLPPTNNTLTLRISCCLGYGVVVAGLLLAGKVDELGIGLGVVMVGMVVLFLVVVIKMGVNMEKFARGLVPISMPSGSANVVLSLVGTTSLGFNLFLGGEMAKGKTLRGAQQGIGFSTSLALAVSVLILIVGSGTHTESNAVFTVENLTGLIAELTGPAGIWVFGIGFIAAALSSMLAVPLGAALTAESVFTLKSTEENTSSDNDSIDESSGFLAAKSPDTALISEAKTNNENKDDTIAYEAQYSSIETENQAKIIIDHHQSKVNRPFPRKYYNGLMLVMVIISAIVIAADAPIVKVILIAQVFNGCLLPFFSICLLLCINDSSFMRSRPQKGWSNCFLVTVVMVTLFLTSNTIFQNVFGWLVGNGHLSESDFEVMKMAVSGVVSVVGMTLLLRLTDLGKAVKRSLGCS